MRNFGDVNTQKFIGRIQQIDWSMYSCDYASFITIFTETFENCFPFEKHNLRNKATPRKPWITKGLARSCMKKDKFYKKYISNPSDDNFSKYKAYRNKLNKTVRSVEKSTMKKNFSRLQIT